MSILNRISKLIAANINHLLDEAEDPEVMVKQIIRDIEESIIELRREAVKAVARQKQLQKQIQTSGDLAEDLESKAEQALTGDDEPLARQILGKKLHTQRAKETLEKELETAAQIADQFRSELTRLEDKLQVALRKKDELVRRSRVAKSQLRSQEAAQRSSQAIGAVKGSLSEAGKAFDSLEDEVVMMESQAEAMKEVFHNDIEKELDLQKMSEDIAIEEEVERLKKKLQKE